MAATRIAKPNLEFLRVVNAPQGQRTTFTALAIFALCLTALAQSAPSPSPTASTKQSEDSLKAILKRMDAAAADFHTTQASFEWIQWEKVIGDVVDTQKGKIFFRRSNGRIEMAADIDQPAPEKQVLFADDKVSLYETRINRVTVYGVGKNRAAFESFLVLGFGGSGEDLLKAFDVTYSGKEKIAGIDADRLDLVPKADKVKNTFSKITLWIDPARGISIQQQLFEPSGDYRLAKYSDITINKSIPEGAFKLKTNNKTQTVSQGS